MADATAPEHAVSRRNFLQLLTAAGTAVAAGATLWPLLDALNPDAAEQAAAHPLVSVAALAAGSVMSVTWNGEPVLIRRLTPQQMANAQAVVPDTLADSANFTSRVKPGYESYVVVVGLNTATPCELDQTDTGWTCPCDGSAYDVLGRVTQGPASRNLVIPRFTFVTAAQIRLG
jgi:ubiquinol-cytochrome c reductase iron-sulfur subunit